MFCYCQLPLELSLSQQSIPVFFIHKFLLMESSIYRKRGKRIEQNIYWMVPSSEIAQACNFFIQFQITYQLNTGPIALYTKEINWTLILYLASPRYRISLQLFCWNFLTSSSFSFLIILPDGANRNFVAYRLYCIEENNQENWKIRIYPSCTILLYLQRD